jgi:hypothetical protein
MSESRVRENRTHGSMRRREATNASRARTRRAAAEASRRPYNQQAGVARGVLPDRPRRVSRKGVSSERLKTLLECSSGSSCKFAPE